ncbi:hypothetical protein Nizo3400_1624 [Lactiplantibacillus plantarum]|nr:hypothetical protein Nizo3400_1624 [Lactiplantibacillus plantarum]
MVVILAQMEVPVQILDQVRAIRRALLEIIQVLALVRQLHRLLLTTVLLRQVRLA